jgi:alpha-glucosidase
MLCWAMILQTPKRMTARRRITGIFSDGRPESMIYLEEIRSVIAAFTDRIGHFYCKERLRFHWPLNFGLLDTPPNTLLLQGQTDAYFNAIAEGVCPDWVIGKHDKRRAAYRLGEPQARILAMLVLTGGTSFLFAGEELGIVQVLIPPDHLRFCCGLMKGSW